uniref:KIB1-4 beta-propeller domain-containing protein n=1 Tax=Aegilops tauschii TaxID=37682 RepID=M8BZF7_AEGTA
MQLVKPRTVRNWMSRHVAISAAGVVVLVHMPHGEASYARPGDERWTSLSSHLEPDAIAVVHNDDDGLFYVLCEGGGILFAVVDDGPAAPTAWPMSYLLTTFDRRHTHYLVLRGGELLLVTTDKATAADETTGGREGCLHHWHLYREGRHAFVCPSDHKGQGLSRQYVEGLAYTRRR